jgi:hypothetical protein
VLQERYYNFQSTSLPTTDVYAHSESTDLLGEDNFKLSGKRNDIGLNGIGFRPVNKRIRCS